MNRRSDGARSTHADRAAPTAARPKDRRSRPCAPQPRQQDERRRCRYRHRRRNGQAVPPIAPDRAHWRPCKKIIDARSRAVRPRPGRRQPPPCRRTAGATNAPPGDSGLRANSSPWRRSLVPGLEAAHQPIGCCRRRRRTRVTRRRRNCHQWFKSSRFFALTSETRKIVVRLMDGQLVRAKRKNLRAPL